MLTSKNECLICGKDHGNLPCPETAPISKINSYPDRKPLGDRVKAGETCFWLLEFNTQDWIMAKLIDTDTVLLLDNGLLVCLHDIRNVPSLPIIKPERVTHQEATMPENLESESVITEKFIREQWLIHHQEILSGLRRGVPRYDLDVDGKVLSFYLKPIIDTFSSWNLEGVCEKTQLLLLREGGDL